jgi:hypothetical protein
MSGRGAASAAGAAIVTPAGVETLHRIDGALIQLIKRLGGTGRRRRHQALCLRLDFGALGRLADTGIIILVRGVVLRQRRAHAG